MGVTRWEHAKKHLREASLRLRIWAIAIIPKPGSHGHSWGYLRCPACGDHKSAWSTPKNVDNHAKDLIRWASRHTHKER